MIEILKHGMITGAKRRFSITCPFCLCKFNFEDEHQIGVKYTIGNNENV